MNSELNKSFTSGTYIKQIGNGEIGEKAEGILTAYKRINEEFDDSKFPSINIVFPSTYIIKSDIFDNFIENNNLLNISKYYKNDNKIKSIFYNQHLPVELLPELWNIVEENNSPLAIRSSAYLKSKIKNPFFGNYFTKLIPNSSDSISQRFENLQNAIKLVYASAYLKSVKRKIKDTNYQIGDEKISIVIQNVIGKKHSDLFYPTFSGVVKSHNFYPFGKTTPKDGVVSLALGLGKTIVDNDLTWNYSLNYPKKNQPFLSNQIMLNKTQHKFWALKLTSENVAEIIEEDQYLVQNDLDLAEKDGELDFVVSTFDFSNDTVLTGIHDNGARFINFAPLLKLNSFNFNSFLKEFLSFSENIFEAPVEFEFSANIKDKYIDFSILQIRSQYKKNKNVIISGKEKEFKNFLHYTEYCLGNTDNDTIQDIVLLRPNTNISANKKKIANELSKFNQYLKNSKTKYLLMVNGRLGIENSEYGIPVKWEDINGAKAILEAAISPVNKTINTPFLQELSVNKSKYLADTIENYLQIDWGWINLQNVVNEKEFVKHIRLTSPLTIKIDGKTGKGVILK